MQKTLCSSILTEVWQKSFFGIKPLKHPQYIDVSISYSVHLAWHFWQSMYSIHSLHIQIVLHTKSMSQLSMYSGLPENIENKQLTWTLKSTEDIFWWFNRFLLLVFYVTMSTQMQCVSSIKIDTVRYSYIFRFCMDFKIHSPLSHFTLAL